MEMATVVSVTQTLSTVLQKSELQEICSILGYRSELDKLEKTVATIRAVVLDAEAKQEELSHEAQLWVQELKDAIYDADDFLDEFLTLAEQKPLMEGGKFSKKVGLFLSRFNRLGVAYNMSQGFKEIRKKLDAIASNHTQFGLSINYQPIRRRREGTCSYVFPENIIGREADTEKIVGMLLDSDVQQDVSFLTIVGIGGLGKTTLAQLVYNHGRVTNEFDLRVWACVSDQDETRLDMRRILSRILESAMAYKHDGSSLDQLQSLLQDQLAGKKYLIILDDVWSQESDEWIKLRQLLKGGRRGSWIMVTTRTRIAASVIGDLVYELPGLSEEHSWSLFERLAFEEGKEQADSHLVEIGHEIVKACANNPLALSVVGSLLYGQDKNLWLSCKEIGLFKIRHGENGVVAILKFSYCHLESPLRSCFNYCALFPKGYELEKDMLISLWMAQGYIVLVYEAQSIEDVAEEYFSILLQRYFFQEVRTDEFGSIISCKIHDLMHDIALEMGGKEICAVNSITSGLDKKTRHVFVEEIIFTGSLLSKTKIRTYLQVKQNVMSDSLVDTIVSNCRCLRVLDLHKTYIRNLPSTIDKLLHLRYLNLSWNENVEELPQSITKLRNLQTLNLKHCWRLKELPKNMSKLVKLRILDVEGCSSLTYMPWGMSKLSCLRKLTMFVVAEANSSRKQSVVDQLEDLKTLTNLRDNLEIWIRIPKNVGYMKGDDRGGGYLRNMQHLKHIDIAWEHQESDGRCDYEEALLEHLLPHSNLRFLSLVDYHGVRMPSWAREDNLATYLPNLVKIQLVRCHGLRYLPSLKKPPYLKTLVLDDLRNLEYVEITNTSTNASESRAEDLSFFPSLEELQLWDLPILKEWWGGMGVGDAQLVDSSRQPHLWPSFPRLSHLLIRSCPNLMSVPLCPGLVSLTLDESNERLRTIIMGKNHRGERGATSLSLYHHEMKSLAHDPTSGDMEITTQNSDATGESLKKASSGLVTETKGKMIVGEEIEVESDHETEFTRPSHDSWLNRSIESSIEPNISSSVSIAGPSHETPEIITTTSAQTHSVKGPSFQAQALADGNAEKKTSSIEQGSSVDLKTSNTITEELRLQMEIQKLLDEQLEIETELQLPIEEQRKYLLHVLKNHETELYGCIEPNISVSVPVTASCAEVLSTVESWELFCNQVGNDIIHSPEIEPCARAIAEKCRHGLPLMIHIVGSALRGESSVAEWELALRIFQFSDTYSATRLIRYSYDRLKARDVKTCFLCCALSPRDREIDVSLLVDCFVNEGLLGGKTIAAYKRGHDIVRLLVNASLLEASDNGLTVKMHNVIRDSALEILSSDIEGHRLLMGSYSRTSLVQRFGESSSAITSVDKYITRNGAQLKEPPPLEEWEQADMIFLMDNELSSLPTKPNCPNLVALLLQRNNSLRVIPTTFFDGMCTLEILNLSSTRINSLPESLSMLENLRVLLLCDCERLFTLPPPIESLKLLEVLDLQGTELSHLPDFVGNLASLKQLRVSFYGSMNRSEYNSLPKKLISDGIISRLKLSELGLFVFPGDPRWLLSAPHIAEEVSSLKLSSLCFHFPCARDLENVVESRSWKNGDLTAFEFIVGHDFKHIVSRVSQNIETMYRKEERCLRYVNGEDIPDEVVEVLSQATAFYLDHHLNISDFSKFGLDKMRDLKICILRDCPEIQEIVNVGEKAEVVLPFLEYLSINHLSNLERIWVGHAEMGSLARLRYLSLSSCPKLSYVLTCSMLGILHNLEELVIERCPSLEQVVIEDDVVVAGGYTVLGSLKVLKLHYLPKLSCIWKGPWPRVEFMSFYNCLELKNLHMNADDDVNIKEIAAEKTWWNSLVWDDPVLSERLDNHVTKICMDDL